MKQITIIILYLISVTAWASEKSRYFNFTSKEFDENIIEDLCQNYLIEQLWNLHQIKAEREDLLQIDIPTLSLSELVSININNRSKYPFDIKKSIAEKFLSSRLLKENISWSKLIDPVFYPGPHLSSLFDKNSKSFSTASNYISLDVMKDQSLQALSIYYQLLKEKDSHRIINEFLYDINLLITGFKKKNKKIDLYTDLDIFLFDVKKIKRSTRIQIGQLSTKIFEIINPDQLHHFVDIKSLDLPLPTSFDQINTNDLYLSLEESSYYLKGICSLLDEVEKIENKNLSEEIKIIEENISSYRNKIKDQVQFLVEKYNKSIKDFQSYTRKLSSYKDSLDKYPANNYKKRNLKIFKNLVKAILDTQLNISKIKHDFNYYRSVITILKKSANIEHIKKNFKEKGRPSISDFLP